MSDDAKKDESIVNDQTKYNRTALPNNKKPKANVVRISVLSPAERERYLGTIDASLDQTFKTPVYNTVFKDMDVFYGLLQGTNDLSIDIQPKWDDDPNGGGVGGMLRKLASDALDSTGPGKMIMGAGDLIKKATGINSSSTGSSTMQSFSGVSIGDFSIECAWYLPEQSELCRHSLKIISRMAYPVHMPSENVKEATNAALNSIANATDNSALKDVITGAQPTVDMGIDVLNKMGDALGVTLTLDPLPVRCMIGQAIDIEPLVIKDLKISFSKDTFVDTVTNRHMPITCTVNIGFKFWLTPSPKFQFMELLGEEMFGEGLTISESEAQDDYLNLLGAKQPNNTYGQDKNANGYNKPNTGDLLSGPRRKYNT